MSPLSSLVVLGFRPKGSFGLVLGLIIMERVSVRVSK